MNSSPPCPPQLEPHHWHEWLVGSKVNPALTALNVRSLFGTEAYDYLLYSDKLPRRNDGRLSSGILQSYGHIEAGGWWSSGVDVLSPTFDASLWGCFKPDTPRISVDKGKPIKYEHPPKVDTELFALKVTWAIGLKIARRLNHEQEYAQRLLHEYRRLKQGTQGKDNGVEPKAGHNQRTSGRGFKNAPDRQKQKNQNHDAVASFLIEGAIAHLRHLEDQFFWRWVLDTPSIPVTVTEGAKKAGSLLSAGYAALALPGIWGGYRQPKDGQGNKIGNQKLIPQLEAFAGAGREVVFVFDSDTKPKTIANVRKALALTGKLLQQQGCKVSVVTWSYPEKGVDDLIAALGAECFHALYDDRISLEGFQLLELTDLSPYVNWRVNQRYLGSVVSHQSSVINTQSTLNTQHSSNQLLAVNSQHSAISSDQASLMTDLSPPDNAQIIGIKSAKGTGKTEWLTNIVEGAVANGQRVLVLSHRVQLGQALCARFGIDYVTEFRCSETKGVFGYGLCVDSLHEKSVARFNPADWEGALVIVDEAEQVFWHLLNSSTCQHNRVPILKSLKEVLRMAVAGGGKIWLADADLSPIALQYTQQLLGFPSPTWVVENQHVPNVGQRRCFLYEDNDPSNLVNELVKHIKDGGKPFVFTGAQKISSKWGTQNLESYLARKFPDKRILRIDSESISEPGHPAYGCISHLNEVLGQYDVVIASPAIETGVSVDLRGHFTTVWEIAQGVQTVDSVCQTLARLRENVPRHVWAAHRGLNVVGNGSTNVKGLLASQHKLAKANIQLLREADDLDLDLFEPNFQKESLLAWAKRACVVNAGMRRYREAIAQKLVAEGYELVRFQIEEDALANAEEVKEEIKETKNLNYEQHRIEVSHAESVTEAELLELKDKRAKTKAERLKQRKGELTKRYGGEITPSLVEKDDLGWYPKLRLHYYLTVGAEFLRDRDKRSLLKMAEAGEGSVFKPDVNKRLRGAKTKTLEIINLTQFLDPEQEFTSESLTDWQNTLISQRHDIKTLTGISISPDKDETPIQLAQRFLTQLLGLKLKCVGKRGERGSQIRVYRGCSPNPDGRQEIFERWWSRDRSLLEREAQAVTVPTPAENVKNDTVATLSINTYIPTETVATEQGDTETSSQNLDLPEISGTPNQQTEPPSSRTLQTGESVLIYHPFYEDRYKWSIKGIIQKVAQHATDCWEVLVDGVVRKVWYREWLFPATEGKGFDST